MTPENEPGPSETNEQSPSDTEQLDETELKARRIAVLKALRQQFANLGYDETTQPQYSAENDDASDISFEATTHDRGTIKVGMELSGEVVISTAFNPEEWQPLVRNQMAKELSLISESIISTNPGAKVEFHDFNGQSYNIPEIVDIKPTEPDSGPPKVPLDQQDLHMDTRRGMWYGTPKKRE